jgi:RNA polymerase sigma factor (sigma-70 family)
MNDDAQCLRRYAENGSEEAFRELVDRHLSLVYSTALRMLNGDVHLAEDVAQRVFSDVARKARNLSHQTVLAGWLHRHTAFTASKVVRSEHRRRAREEEVVRMTLLPEGEPVDDRWQQVEPHLDQALDSLGRPGRDAVVLRYLLSRDLRSVGQALGCSEDAAQKRVARAVDKLRAFLARRGITLSAAALSTLLGSHAAGAAPTGLAAVITTSAITSTSAAGAGVGATSTLFYSMITENLTTVAVSGLLVVGLGTPLALQHHAKRSLETENQALRQQVELVDQLRAENQLLAAVHMDAEEAERLRRDNAELHRLRGEVALLRREQEQVARVAAENAALRERLEAFATDTQASAMFLAEREAFREAGYERLNAAKSWAFALITYAQRNDGQLPSSTAEALAFLPEADDPLPSEIEVELLYTGNWLEIEGHNRTLLLREKEPRLSPDGLWSRAYGFADGHSEMRTDPTGDFSAWEAERLPTSMLR